MNNPLPNTLKMLEIMAQLRDPKQGCPWDVEQDFNTLTPYTLEEAYEVVDAIERQDFAGLKEELGDLLLQIIFYCQIASERGLFDFEEVAGGLNDKLIRRHPHVFEEAVYTTAQEQQAVWDEIKRQEKGEQATTGVLDSVPANLPALAEAQKLQKRASKIGFDWDSAEPIFAKLSEETEEVREAMALDDSAACLEEVGDLLFVVTNLARHLRVDAQQALSHANHKFRRRIGQMEQMAKGMGRGLQELSLDQQEQLWQRTKEIERQAG